MCILKPRQYARCIAQCAQVQPITATEPMAHAAISRQQQQQRWQQGNMQALMDTNCRLLLAFPLSRAIGGARTCRSTTSTSTRPTLSGSGSVAAHSSTAGSTHLWHSSVFASAAEPLARRAAWRKQGVPARNVKHSFDKGQRPCARGSPLIMRLAEATERQRICCRLVSCRGERATP